ncbi:hypothetical protein EL22_21810 [Halostagnicola sp. A56]|uniref:hypothetical protein n=1 Tax=Halostagnicola sp. A56 TaxID=1495067 RepID=UPI0004A144C3|nr:hypothetical protein [Halostagnicola sp. A56]KDE59448.1 hypothetical protein EL22_21810 [Halostagnicola sp. A56]
MSDTADGLRRFADVVDVFQDTSIDIDDARLLEADDETLHGQLTVTVHDDDLEGFGDPTEAADRRDDEGDATEATLDHTDTEDLERAYNAADGNISAAAERFEVGYSAVYNRMVENGIHERQSGTSTEDDTTEPKSELEAPVNLEEDATDDSPAGTGDDESDSLPSPDGQENETYIEDNTNERVSEVPNADLEADDSSAGTGDDVQKDTDEITVDAVDGEKDEPDVALPDGVTEADVLAIVDEFDALGTVADKLGVTRGRARTITVALGCYGDVREVSGGNQ